MPLHLLPQQSFQRLCEELVIEKAAVGEVLFERGSQDADWIYLLEGEVELEADGIVMERIGGGSEVARFPLAHQVPRKVSARAVSELRYVRIDPRRWKLMDSYQDEALRIDSEDLGHHSGDWMGKLFRSPVFQRLPASNLHKIVQRLKTLEVKRGDRIIAQGEAGDCLYILRAGKCQVTRRPRPDARAIKLAELAPGDLFGEDALLSGQPSAMDVTMLTDGVVLRLEKEDFLSLVVEPVLEELDFESAEREVKQGAVWLDVRDPESFQHWHLEGSLNLPFFSLKMQLSSLERQRKYILVCAQGGQSRAGAFLLLRFGFQAAVLAGGLAKIAPKQLEDVRPARVSEAIASEPAALSHSQEAVLAQEIKRLQAEIDRLREENQALRQAIEQESALRQELARLCQEKQALEVELSARCARIEELEEVIRQYCEAAAVEGTGEVIQALETELEMVREQADRDVAAMRSEVEEARLECKRLERLLASAESRSSAALPPELIAVTPEELPLLPPQPETAPPSPPKWIAVLWLLVGVLLSLAGLGIGMQTEAGRDWMMSWLESSAQKPIVQPKTSDARQPEAEDLFAE
jgi:CRP-like cAMP-binding protein